MHFTNRALWQAAIVATGILIGGGAVSAMPGQGYGYGKHHGPMRGYYSPHRAFRGYRPYGRYGYRRPYRAYGRYTPYAYRYQGPGVAVPGYAYEANPHSRGAGYVAMADAEKPKKIAQGKDETRVEIANMRFSPAKLTVKAGETVTWSQLSNMPHTVTADDGSFDSPTLGQNRDFSVTFDKPGSYSYYCKLHPSMKGEVEVL